MVLVKAFCGSLLTTCLANSLARPLIAWLAAEAPIITPTNSVNISEAVSVKFPFSSLKSGNPYRYASF